MTITKHKKIIHSAYSIISVFNYTIGLYMKTANVKKNYQIKTHSLYYKITAI